MAPKFELNDRAVASHARLYDAGIGGFFYYANDLKLTVRARTKWQRDIGLNQSELGLEHETLSTESSSTMEYLMLATRCMETGYRRVYQHWSAALRIEGQTPFVATSTPRID